mmetsp:Transcript_36967/g.55061  ORF Transcript_36967/g.55061 Transcript_36967/m.55061 type:complete len:215 (-) Transcript_36967:831-1475(-)
MWLYFFLTSRVARAVLAVSDSTEICKFAFQSFVFRNVQRRKLAIAERLDTLRKITIHNLPISGILGLFQTIPFPFSKDGWFRGLCSEKNCHFNAGCIFHPFQQEPSIHERAFNPLVSLCRNFTRFHLHKIYLGTIPDNAVDARKIISTWHPVEAGLVALPSVDQVCNIPPIIFCVDRTTNPFRNVFFLNIVLLTLYHRDAFQVDSFVILPLASN